MNLLAEPRWNEAWGHLGDYLGSHVQVSVSAIALGLVVSLPLAILARNRPVMRSLLLSLASIVQTVPGLALLALFYPLLLAAAALTLKWFGFGFSAFGFLPAVLALALYSMLPVLRNTITGLRGIEPSILEAAQGVGMTPLQSLVQVELPLALPVMMAGIRTASVWVIGTATLSTPIGQTSLGNYIFAGLQTQNWVFVLFGCAAAALLALAVDQLLALTEAGLRRRNSLRTALGGAGLAALIATTLVPSVTARATSTYVAGAKTFTEQYVLAALIGQRLAAAGLPSTTRAGLGSNVIYQALVNGDIDVYVDYSGTLWSNQFHHDGLKPRQQLLAELKAELARQNVTLLGELGFENAYALVIPGKRAEKFGIRTVADLAAMAPTLSIAADYEFFSRPEWTALRTAYGLNFREQRQMQPDFMYAAVASGEVDVIAGYTSDGLIAKYDLVTLGDPKGVIPPYDAVVLIAPKRAEDHVLREALRPLLGRIDIAAMREANLRAAGGDGNASPDTVARWLWESSRADGSKPNDSAR
jgi:osmoprotectant transport system permease protein